MNIVFLDFYGVLTGGYDFDGPGFDPKCGALIESLCQKFDAKIVIISDAMQEPEPSSTDILMYEKLDLALQDLNRCGINTDRVIGYTTQPWDSIYWERPAQILSWINANDVSNYVIFDDLPLPFSERKIQEIVNRINSWDDTDQKEKYLQRLPKANPAEEKHFVRINNYLGLTIQDIEKAERILKG